MTNIPTDRECRCNPQKYELDKSKTGVLKICDGSLRRDGDISIQGSMLVAKMNDGYCFNRV